MSVPLTPIEFLFVFISMIFGLIAVFIVMQIINKLFPLEENRI